MTSTTNELKENKRVIVVIKSSIGKTSIILKEPIASTFGSCGKVIASEEKHLLEKIRVSKIELRKK